MGDQIKPLDKTAHHEIGDDKGEGGQADIKTDTVDTSIGGTKDPPTPANLGGNEGSAPSRPGDKPVLSDAAGGVEGAAAGENPGQRQQGDEDLDADREAGQRPQ